MTIGVDKKLLFPAYQKLCIDECFILGNSNCLLKLMLLHKKPSVSDRKIYGTMENRVAKAGLLQRKIEFIGSHKNDSIIIGNYGDVRLIAKGEFELSGLIYCSKNTVEFNIEGSGILTFKGVCKRLLIRGVSGDVTLNLTHLTSRSVWCESIKGDSLITLGPTKTIELISLDQNAVVKYDGTPALLNYSLRGNSRIEGFKPD